jgi:hypothetical protein
MLDGRIKRAYNLTTVGARSAAGEIETMNASDKTAQDRIHELSHREFPNSGVLAELFYTGAISGLCGRSLSAEADRCDAGTGDRNKALAAGFKVGRRFARPQ